MAVKFQLRRDTAANWTANDPILSEGEPGVETDTLKFKLGDGITAWSLLDYTNVDFNDLTNLPTTLSGYGITDAATSAQGSLADSAVQPGDDVSDLNNDAGYLTSVAFGDLTSTPTTLSGYGITDAATSAQGSLADSAVQPNDNISTLTNDSGFITSSAIPTNISSFTNDSGYITSNTSTATTFTGGLTSTGLTTLRQIAEVFTELVGANSTGGTRSVHDLSTGSVFLHTGVTGDFIANFTNLNLAENRGTNISLIIAQGSTAYTLTAIEIGGVSQTINWLSNAPLPPTPNNYDIITISIINNGGTYIVFGASSTFGV